MHPDIWSSYTGLVKKFVQMFPCNATEKPKHFSKIEFSHVICSSSGFFQLIKNVENSLDPWAGLIPVTLSSVLLSSTETAAWRWILGDREGVIGKGEGVSTPSKLKFLTWVVVTWVSILSTFNELHVHSRSSIFRVSVCDILQWKQGQFKSRDYGCSF